MGKRHWCERVAGGRWPRAWWPAAAAVALGSCAPALPPDAEREPVTEAILVVGNRADTLRIYYSRTVSEPFGIGVPPEPVPAALVQLRLIAVGTPGVEVVPSNTPGLLTAAVEIAPNAEYRLQGSVAGKALSGAVVTPSPVVFREPAGDTVVLPRSSQPRLVPYRLATNGGVAEVRTLPPGILTSSDSIGVLTFPGQPDTIAVAFLAFEQQAARYYGAPFDDQWRGNLSEGLGVLGAVAVTRKVFIWR